MKSEQPRDSSLATNLIYKRSLDFARDDGGREVVITMDLSTFALQASVRDGRGEALGMTEG